MALVTALQIKDIAFKGNNAIDESIFTDDFIEMVELTHIRPFFPDVYDILAAGTGLTANQIELQSRLTDPLTHFCKHDIVPELSIDLNNAGAQTFNQEFSSAATDKQRVMLQKQIFTHAQARMDEVMRWFDDQDDLVELTDETPTDFDGDIII